MDTLKDQIRNEIIKELSLGDLCKIKYGDNMDKQDCDWYRLMLDRRIEGVKIRFIDKVKKELFDKNQDYVVILNEKIHMDDLYKNVTVIEISEDDLYEISWYASKDNLILMVPYSKTLDRFYSAGVKILDSTLKGLNPSRF